MAVIKHGGATQKVLQYLRQHPDVEIPYKEIEAALEFPNYTVSNAVGYLIQKGMGVERAMNGVVIYRSTRQLEIPKKKTEFDLFENVGNVGDGRLVLRDEKGELWVAMPIREFIR